MRSKIFQKVLNRIESLPFYKRWLINLKIEFYVFKALGFKYFNKILGRFLD